MLAILYNRIIIILLLVCVQLLIDLTSSVRILKCSTLFMLVHVQCHLTALPNDSLSVSLIALQYLKALLRGYGAKSLGTLVSHHSILPKIIQPLSQAIDSGFILHLTQDVGYLVLKQSTRVCKSTHKSENCLSPSTVSESKHCPIAQEEREGGVSELVPPFWDGSRHQRRGRVN